MIAPIKIIIEGDYWDCQIYRGRLYLWTFDGDVIVYNWDEFIQSISVSHSEQLALICAFCQGDYLYNSHFKLFFQNQEIKDILIEQFQHLSRRQFVFTKQQLEKFVRGSQKIPTSELPVDTGMYMNTIFSADDTGLYKIGAHREKGKYPINTKPKKIWDCSSLSIRIGNRGNIAISAGNEGLYEYVEAALPGVERISNQHSSFSNWAFSSIYSSSFTQNSYLAPCNVDLFKRNKRSKNEIVDFYFPEIEFDSNPEENPDSRNKEYYVSKEIINESRIFGEYRGLSWACNEKFYKYNDGKLTIVNFIQSNLKKGDREAFTNLRSITLNKWKGRVISSGVSYFGTIVECENAIIVLASDGSTMTIPGSAVRWRVYPRTIRYENHLHIIRESSIEIHSFNNDYFIDQRSKNYGIEYRYREKGMKMIFH